MIRVFDIETTGIEKTDKIVEIGWADLYDGRVRRPSGLLINPGIHIPPEISAVHHIIDADVKDAQPWDVEYALLKEGLRNGVVLAVAAHNASFEQMHLDFGLPWICTYKCALRVWPEAPNHKNQTLRYWMNPPDLDRRLAMTAHRAPEDAYVTAFILRALLCEAPLEQLIAWSLEPALLVRCGFGKHGPSSLVPRGKLWSQVPKDYLRWMLSQDFDEDSRFTAKHWLTK